MNLLTKTTNLAMELTLKYIEKGDYVIDATCGNGHDTLCLAEAVGEEGDVLALDIQREALETSKALMAEHDIKQVCFAQANFKDMRKFSSFAFPDLQPSAVVFNLGYLPGGDKALTTTAEDSLEAVKAALDLIKPGGIVTVVLYSGHEEGAKEKQAILDFAENLSSQEYHVVYANLLNQKKNPPEVVWLTKKF